MKNEILIPKLGWSIDEAVFVEWHKSNGDYINSGDDIFSVESDKAIQVVESIDSGWLWIDPEVPKEGQILKFGTVIGYLSEDKTNTTINLKIDDHENVENNQISNQLDKDEINTIEEFDKRAGTQEGDNKLNISDRIIISPRAKSVAKRLNIDIKKVHEIMKNASGNSWPISVYPPLPGLIEGTPSNNNYRPGFSAGMMNKDLKLANECAKQVKASTPLGTMALEIYNKFCEEGNDTKDFSAISKVVGGDAWNYPID